MDADGERTWKVGRLAQASGLTVRTLHHWDAIGLLTPSRRTEGGHRAYTEEDVARLYSVMALRGLGLGLDSIAVCLDAGIDPERLVRDQLAEVDGSIEALGRLRGRLVRLADALAEGTVPSTEALVDALAAMGGGPEAEAVLRRRLDEQQMDVLRTRARALGPLAHYLLEIEWPELYRRAERLRAAGTPPEDPAVRALAARMDELGTLFGGADRTVSQAVRTAWREEPAAMAGDPGAPADAYRALADYLDRARAAGDPEPSRTRGNSAADAHEGEERPDGRA